MSAAPWDAAAAKTLRQADILLAAGSIAWFEALCRPFGDDPFDCFDRLIRQSLGPTGTAARAAPGEFQAGMVAPSRRPAPWPRADRPTATSPIAAPLGAMPSSARWGISALPAPQKLLPPPAQGAAVGRTAASLASATPYATPYAASAAQSWAVGRQSAPALGLVASATAALDRRTIAASHRAAPEPAPSTSRVGAGATAGTTPAPRPGVAPAGAPATRGASILDWPLHPPAAPFAAAAWPDAAPALAGAAPPGAAAELNLPSDQGSASRAWPQTTRLVAGMPALQGLLRAVVADSRERHALPPPADADGGVAAAVGAVVTMPVTPSQALPALDAVAEDILVDRLADRLEERLREQALREFGFSGGLT